MRYNRPMTGQELRQRRLALRLPPGRFALLLGATPANIYYWEKGDHRVPAWVEGKLAEVEATRWPKRVPA